MWTRDLAWRKARLAVLHILLTAMIFGPILYLICRRWYPGPLFYTDGGGDGLRIVVLVDFVLGPSLTFLLFNPAKTRRALTVDFVLIGLMQVAALAYGARNVSASGIGAVAFFDNQFKGVYQAHLDKQHITDAQWQPLGEGPPYWVYMRPPPLAEAQELIYKAMEMEIPPEAMFQLFQPVAEHMTEMKRAEVDMQAASAANPALAADYAAFTASHADLAGRLHYFRLVGFYRIVVIVLDDQGQYVGMLRHEVPRVNVPLPEPVPATPVVAPAPSTAG